MLSKQHKCCEKNNILFSREKKNLNKNKLKRRINMSATLGPIHYWLYEKIRNQEDLTKVIAEYAKKEEWLTDISKYVYILPRLEDTIDEDNIHGWLQEKINDAEIRFSRLIIELLKNDENRIDEICTVAFEFGKKNAIQPEVSTSKS